MTASIGWGLWTLKTEAEHREYEEPLEVASTPSVEEEGWLPSGDSSDFRSNLKERESTFINAPAPAIFFKPIVAPTLMLLTKAKGLSKALQFGFVESYKALKPNRPRTNKQASVKGTRSQTNQVTWKLEVQLQPLVTQSHLTKLIRLWRLSARCFLVTY